MGGLRNGVLHRLGTQDKRGGGTGLRREDKWRLLRSRTPFVHSSHGESGLLSQDEFVLIVHSKPSQTAGVPPRLWMPRVMEAPKTPGNARELSLGCQARLTSLRSARTRS